MTRKKSQWTLVTDAMEGGREVDLGCCRSSWFKGSWHRALCFAAYYKFAAKMIGRGKRVLDVGCGGGLGTWILAKECGFAKGIDQDREAIALAQKNWRVERIDFECCGLAELQPSAWNALVNLDAGRGLAEANMRPFFMAIKRNLSHDGIVVLGVPDSLRQKSLRDKAERLEEEMRCFFHHVFMFSACDEVIHAGNLRAADYRIAVGCRKK